MAELATAFVRIRPNLTGFRQEAEAGTKTAGAALGKVFALAFGTVAAEELARHVITAAAQQDAQFAKIKQLTKSAGAQWEIYGQTVQEQLINKAEKSGFSVDQLAQAYGRLIQQTKNTREALQLVTTASDVARARGTAVTQVATSLSRAYAGNAQALSRLGIIVPKYTAQQDAAKKKLQELAEAETALAEIRKGQAPINLDAQAKAYETLGATQRTELKATLTAQLAAAAASDKLVGAQKTLAQVAQRFKGQGSIFGTTAAGEADRFQVSVHELEVSIGDHLLPLLGGAAQKGREWAVALENSNEVGRAAQAVAEGIASGVSSIASAIATAYPAIKLTAQAIGAVLGTVGAGPLLATYAAYRTLGLGVNLYVQAEKKVVAARAAATAAQAAETEGSTAATVSTSAQTAATEGLVAAERELAAAQEWAALAVGTQAEAQTAAAVTAAELGVADAALAVAETEAATAAGALDVALGFLTGPTAILVGIAAVAGGIYFLSTQASETEQAVNRVRDAYGALSKAAADVSTTRGDVGAAGQAVTSARIAREQAAAQLAAAQQQMTADYSAAHPSAEKLKTDQLNIASAADQWRRANQTLLDSEKAKTQASKASATAISDERQKTLDLIAAQIALSKQDTTNIASRTADREIQSGAAQGAANYAAQLRKLASDTKDTTAAQRFALGQLADYTDAIGKIPSEKTIRLTLDDATFYAKLQKDVGVLKSAGAAFLDLFKPHEAITASRGAAALPTAAAKKLSVDVANATIGGVAAAGPSIAQQVAKSFRDAVLQAKQSLTSIGSTLGSDIGSLLDAQLAASEAKLAASPAAQTIKTLTAEAARLNAQVTARDATAQIDTTLQTLQGLQAAFGTGPHTAAQDQQLTAAQNAYLDAQDNAQASSDTSQASHLQTQLDATKASLEKRNAAEKTAAAQRIADLNDQLNRGVITEQQYAKRLPGILAAEGVHFKDAGHLLGKAFADGFQEQLNAAISQAKVIAGLTPAQRGTGTGGAPIITDPRKVAATTRAGLVTHADNSALTKNTADTVAEIKKLGAVIDKAGTHLHITIPPDVSAKDQATIVKLAKALR